jgi:hypothetical protein
MAWDYSLYPQSHNRPQAGSGIGDGLAGLFVLAGIIWFATEGKELTKQVLTPLLASIDPSGTITTAIVSLACLISTAGGVSAGLSLPLPTI